MKRRLSLRRWLQCRNVSSYETHILKLVKDRSFLQYFRVESPLFQFIESCLRHKCEMVIYEAASAIVRLSKTTSSELSPAVSVLQLFCSSPKPALRFAAVRTLSKVRLGWL